MTKPRVEKQKINLEMIGRWPDSHSSRWPRHFLYLPLDIEGRATVKQPKGDGRANGTRWLMPR